MTPFPEGWRVLVLLDDRVRIRSRSGVDLAPWLPEIVAALSRRRRRRGGVAASELTVVDGVLRWPRCSDGAWPTLAAVDSLTLLDLLVCRGRDVTGYEVPARRDLLRGLGLDDAPVVELAPSWRGSAAAALAQAHHASVAPLAGVLARRPGAPYRPGQQSPDWRLLGDGPRGTERLLCGIAESGAVILGEPTPRGLVFGGATWPTRRWPEIAARCEEGPAAFPKPPLWPSLGRVVWAKPALWLRVVPDRRVASGRAGPTWRLERVQEDLSPPPLTARPGLGSRAAGPSRGLP